MTDSTSSPQGTTVLVATDFSETAEAAADWALEVARARGARLQVLHVVTLPLSQPHYLPAPEDMQQSLQQAAMERLAETVSRLSGQGPEVESELRLGIPSQAIVESAGELAPALLVIGTRGLTGIRHLLLGSTAERVVQNARCPVLTVHPEDAGEHRPIRTILVPTDFSDDADLAIEAAHRLLSSLQEGARLVLVHAYNLPVEYTAYGPVPTSVHYLKDTGSEAQEQLDRMVEKLSGKGLDVEAWAVEGYPPEVIVTEAERIGADLIAMGTHGRSGLAHLLLGSTAERVVQRAPCPVMTVRREESET